VPFYPVEPPPLAERTGRRQARPGGLRGGVAGLQPPARHFHRCAPRRGGGGGGGWFAHTCVVGARHYGPILIPVTLVDAGLARRSERGGAPYEVCLGFGRIVAFYTVHPRCITFTDRLGITLPETTIRPNPRSASWFAAQPSPSTTRMPSSPPARRRWSAPSSKHGSTG
jgi:hypothetical protein